MVTRATHADASSELPGLIAQRRTEIASRVSGLLALDTRLAGLEQHLARPRRSLAVIEQAGTAPCCDAADAVVGSAEGSCACCTPVAAR